jgi:DNA-binding SARP family transcriptional activator/predicted ATPase
MRDLALYFLGPPKIRYDGTAVTISTRKATALLAYLAATTHAPRRESLLALLWPDLDRQRGLAALRTTLSALRKAFDGEWVQTEGDIVALAAGYTCDLHQFQQQLDIAKEPDLADEQRAAALKTAVSLYRDSFLQGFTLADSAEFDDWQLHQAEAYQHKMASALQTLCHILSKQQLWELAISYAQQWVALDPLHEPARRQLMLLLASAGHKSGAIRQFQHLKDLLQTELDVQPEQETVDLYHRFRSDKPAQRAAVLPVRHSLLPFIGRQAEIATIQSWLADANGRLLTLIGVGGVGKTRLAIEVGRIGERPSVFVPLASVSDSQFLVGAVAQALDFSFYGQGSPTNQLLEYLRDKTLLLILDNFEQLLPGAPLLLDILLAAPGVNILTTSRERLHLRGEQLIELHGLPYPAHERSKPADDYLDHPAEAVALFAEVATRLVPHFSLSQALPDVVQICRLVDGLPLAIELAAAWVRMLTCREIGVEIERNIDFLTTTLQDVPRRHRSLRAVFQHSWDLLASETQRLYQQLTVFRGSFDYDAAHHITSATLPQLAELMDKSLLTRDASGRFSIPMGLYPFVEEALQTQTEVETAVRRAHAYYYGSLVQSHSNGLRGGRQKEGLTAVHAELDNVRAAWQWAALQQDEKPLHQMVDALFRFCEMRNLFHEGVDLFKHAAGWELHAPDLYLQRIQMQAMARQGHFTHRLGQQEEATLLLQISLNEARRLRSKTDIAFILNSLGYIAWSQSNYEQAESHYRESLRIYRREGDLWGISQVLNNLAILPQNLGEIRRLLSESLGITRKIGDLWGEVRALNNLGIVVKDRAEALELYERCLRICREIDNQFLITFPLINLGHTARLTGEFAAAETYYRESLQNCREIGYRAGVARSLAQLGTVAYHSGRYEDARRFCQEGLDIADAIGDRRGVGLQQYILGNIEMASATAVLAKQSFQLSLATFRDVQDSQGEGWPLLGLAQVALDAQNWQQAAQNAEAALGVFTAVHDQTGIAAAHALLGVTRDDRAEARAHFAQALQIATSLSAWPLVYDLLYNLAVWSKRANNLTEAIRILQFIKGLETAVSAHIRHRTHELYEEITKVTGSEPDELVASQNLEQLLHSLGF